MGRNHGTAVAAKRRVHPVDEVLPVPRLAAYGFQHVLAFYAGAVLVPILVAGALDLSTEELVHLINADLFTCGIASIIQSAGFWKVGVRLPLLQGVTFTAVSHDRDRALRPRWHRRGCCMIYGAVIVAGLVHVPDGAVLRRSCCASSRRSSPGTVILIIGIALLPVAANDIVDGQYDPGPAGPGAAGERRLRDGHAAMIVAVQRVFRGFLGTIAVLLGLVIGTLVAWGLGDAHFDDVATSAGWATRCPSISAFRPSA